MPFARPISRPQGRRSSLAARSTAFSAPPRTSCMTATTPAASRPRHRISSIRQRRLPRGTDRGLGIVAPSHHLPICAIGKQFTQTLSCKLEIEPSTCSVIITAPTNSGSKRFKRRPCPPLKYIPQDAGIIIDAAILHETKGLSRHQYIDGLTNLVREFCLKM